MKMCPKMFKNHYFLSIFGKNMKKCKIRFFVTEPYRTNFELIFYANESWGRPLSGAYRKNEEFGI